MEIKEKKNKIVKKSKTSKSSKKILSCSNNSLESFKIDKKSSPFEERNLSKSKFKGNKKFI
jgi:hypothetical protein